MCVFRVKAGGPGPGSEGWSELSGRPRDGGGALQRWGSYEVGGTAALWRGGAASNVGA